MYAGLAVAVLAMNQFGRVGSIAVEYVIERQSSSYTQVLFAYTTGENDT
ncbi:MAG: hypothetical protein ACTS73_07240 [Arsenophonus sp. NEOnobi-MAG3]